MKNPLAAAVLALIARLGILPLFGLLLAIFLRLGLLVGGICAAGGITLVMLLTWLDMAYFAYPLAMMAFWPGFSDRILR